MPRHQLTPLLLLGLLAVSSPPAAAQTSPSATLDEVIDRVTQAETDLIARARERRPIVEAYIQEVGPEKDGVQMPLVDAYSLKLMGP